MVSHSLTENIFIYCVWVILLGILTVTIVFTGLHGNISGCDARLALVTLVSPLQQQASEWNAMEMKVLRVLCYLAELQHITYSLAQTRTRRHSSRIGINATVRKVENSRECF